MLGVGSFLGFLNVFCHLCGALTYRCSSWGNILVFNILIRKNKHGAYVIASESGLCFIAADDCVGAKPYLAQVDHDRGAEVVAVAGERNIDVTLNSLVEVSEGVGANLNIKTSTFCEVVRLGDKYSALEPLSFENLDGLSEMINQSLNQIVR